MSAVLTAAPRHDAGALRRLLDRAEYAITVLILFMLSQALLAPVFSPDQNPDSVPWLRTIWLPIYGVIALLLVRDPRRIRHMTASAALSFVLIAWAFASTAWSIDPDVTERRSIALTFTTLFGLYLGATYEWRRLTEMLAGLFFMLAVGTYIACLGFRGFAVNDPVHPGAWNGLWYEKNMLGRMMTYGALTSATAAILAPERRRLWSFSAVLCVGAVAMSRSTTSLLGVALAMGGLFGLFLLRRGASVALVTLWGALSFGGFFLGILVFAPDLFFGLIGKDPSLTGRTDIWAAVLRRVQERPILGYGYGAFWLDPWGPAWFVREEVKWAVPHAHNGWLELLAEIGVVGVALAAAHYLIAASKAALRALRDIEGSWAMLFMVLFALFSVSEPTIMQYNDLAWAVYVAILTKLFQKPEPVPALAARRSVKLFPDE
jgi:O-antigen ligase